MTQARGRGWRNRPLVREPDVPAARSLWRVLGALTIAVSPLGIYLVLQNRYLEQVYELNAVRAEQESLRKEKELLATVIRPTEAERQATVLRAEGERQATILRAEGEKQAQIVKAEATQKELEYEGAGEAAKIEKVGHAEATRVLAVGEAEAEVIKKKLLAEAEGLQRKAEAWKQFNQAAVLNMVIEKMPDLAQAFATQLAGVDRINIIEMGNGGGSGVNRLMGTVGGGVAAMTEMLRDQFGIDLVKLVQARTEAATAQAEKQAQP